MGLFGSIFKAVGKVAKAGLSVATKGVSDKVFAVLKGRGGAKKAEVTPASSQTQAIIEKWRGVAPNVRTTEVLAAVRKRQPRQVARAMKQRYMADEPTQGWSEDQLPRRRRKRKPPRALRARRKPPSGGLDLKALSASWRAAGKPGTWQGWIAANK